MHFIIAPKMYGSQRVGFDFFHEKERKINFFPELIVAIYSVAVRHKIAEIDERNIVNSVRSPNLLLRNVLEYNFTKLERSRISCDPKNTDPFSWFQDAYLTRSNNVNSI